MNSKSESALRISHIKNDFPIDETDGNVWQIASEVAVETYWSGDKAPSERHFRTRLLWSDTGLYIRFEADQAEPLVVSDAPDLTNKVKGLWERDVCEIFIAPDRRHQNKYFEFDLAPTGEWVDLAITLTPTERITDWDYVSGLQAAARIEEDKITMAAKIPWDAFGMTPKWGDVWLGNLYRCVGNGLGRGYLAWQPTKTAESNFHVPSAFGEFEFIR